MVDQIYYSSERAKEAIVASCSYHCDHVLQDCAEFAFIQFSTTTSCSFYNQQGRFDTDEKAQQGCVCYRQSF